MIANKTYIIFFLLLYTSLGSFAQVKIGDDVSKINSSSLLELESTSKVLVLTRVTDSQMLSIKPLNGALVFNTDAHCVFSFNGNRWQNLCDSSADLISLLDNEDGSFTLSSSNGTTFTSPNSASLKGEKGSIGPQGLPGENGNNGNDGKDGLSAFQIATNNGFSGTETQWLVSLKGADGNDGQDGQNGNDGATGAAGADGQNGEDGENGLSAFQIATNNGFSGTETQWMASLQGTDGNDGQDGQNGNDGATGAAGANGQNGEDGEDGLSAFQIATNNGFSGTEAQWLASLQGADGDDGQDGQNGNDGATGAAGANGQNGEDGEDGLSAFQVATNNGFSGTEAQWLASLQGADGNNGQDGQNGNDGATGAAGANGQNGEDGEDGLSAFQIATNNGFSGTEAQWLASLQGADGNDGQDGNDGIDGTTAIVQILDSPSANTTLSTSVLASYLQTEILTQSSVFSTSSLTGTSAAELSIVAETFNPIISNIIGAKYVGEIQWEILETLGIFKNRFAIYVNGSRVTPVLNIWPNVINLTSAPTSRFFEYTSNGNDVIELRMSRSTGAIGVSQVLNAQLKLRRSL